MVPHRRPRRSILYELQPFRWKDVKILKKWIVLNCVQIWHLILSLISSIFSFKSYSRPYLLMCFIIWGALLFFALKRGHGEVFIITTCLLLIFTNMSIRQTHEASAYSVFNRGFRPLWGTTTRVDDQIRNMATMGRVRQVDDTTNYYAMPAAAENGNES